MTIDELDKKLNQALIDFSNEMRASYSDDGREPATEADISTVSRHVFYTLDTFREEIIKYLKNK